MQSEVRNVVVVMPTHLWCYRELLRGIGAFANAKATWRVRYFTPQDNFVDLMRAQPTDGLLLGDALSAEAGTAAAGLARFTVGTCGQHVDDGVPVSASVDVDDLRVGEMAAEHFLQKRHATYAFIGFVTAEWSAGRMRGFQRRLAEAGHSAACLLPDWEAATTGRGWRTAYPNTELVPFIQSLPKPLALMACNDLRGREIVEACRRAELRVPEDVAVLGVDDDPLDCQLAHPPLSSVCIPWDRIGFLAASQLDGLLEGKPVPRATKVPPVGVTERQSTESVAISDPDVASALLFIREHAHVAFGVDDLVRAVPLGRRTLEKRFRALLGRSLLDEIRRVHLERARSLLVQTDLPIAEVAARSGFEDLSWFSATFRKAAGASPLGYRRKFRR